MLKLLAIYEIRNKINFSQWNNVFIIVMSSKSISNARKGKCSDKNKSANDRKSGGSNKPKRPDSHRKGKQGGNGSKGWWLFIS